MDNVNRDYRKCLETIDGLIDMKARKEVEEADYIRRMADVRKEKSRLEELLNDSKNNQDVWIEVANETFTFAAYARKRFETGTPQERRLILTKLGANIILKDQKLTITIEPPLLTVQKTRKEIDLSKITTFEPLDFAQNKEKSAAFDDACPAWLCILKIVRTHFAACGGEEAPPASAAPPRR